jgi:hypothetical protein
LLLMLIDATQVQWWIRLLPKIQITILGMRVTLFFYLATVDGLSESKYNLNKVLSCRIMLQAFCGGNLMWM